MDNNQQQQSPPQSDIDHSAYIDNAIRAVKQKKPLPEIDFTLHTMEDGTQVSTLERVCKGMPLYPTSAPSLPKLPAYLLAKPQNC